MCYNPRVVTKRQLGVFLTIVGVAVAGGTVAVDWVGVGEWGGFGPLQWIGLCGGVVLLLVGLILIRLGNRPA